MVQALVRAGEPVRALVRDADRPLPAGVEVAVGDLNDPASLTDPLRGVRGAFVMPGYPTLNREITRAGVERLVLLSGSGAGAKDPDNPVSRYQLESEDAVRAAGAPWTIRATSPPSPPPHSSTAISTPARHTG